MGERHYIGPCCDVLPDFKNENSRLTKSLIQWVQNLLEFLIYIVGT